MMGSTVTEKILAKSVGMDTVKAGDSILANIDGLMGHDLKASAFKTFERNFKGRNVFDPEKVWMVFDHYVPASSAESASQQKILRNFIEKYRISNFFDVGRGGICHVVVPEQGLVRPGDVVAGGDSHTCTYGALGAFSTGIGNTDFAFALAYGKLWLRVPETIKIECYGSLPDYAGGKDVILKVLKNMGADGANYKTLEFSGETIHHLPMYERLTICNMVVEAGAKNGIIAPDEITRKYLQDVAQKSMDEDWAWISSDENAHFCQTIKLDCSTLSPQVACPHSPDNVCDIEELERTFLDQVFIGSCTNGRIEDLRIAANILNGRRLPGSMRLIIIPGSQQILNQAITEGLINIFIKCGAIIGPPNCGPCAGGHMGLIAEGEVVLSTSNRNFRGRMGHPDSSIYLSSPAVAAASAITGYIAHPKEVEKK